jgi:hypothetical protein
MSTDDLFRTITQGVAEPARRLATTTDEGRGRTTDQRDQDISISLESMLQTQAANVANMSQWVQEKQAAEDELATLVRSTARAEIEARQAELNEFRTNTKTQAALVSEVNQRMTQLNTARMENAQRMEEGGLLGRVVGNWRDSQIRSSMAQYARVGTQAYQQKLNALDATQRKIQEREVTEFAAKKLAIVEARDKIVAQFNPEGVAKVQQMWKESFAQTLQVSDRLDLQNQRVVATEEAKRQAGSKHALVNHMMFLANMEDTEENRQVALAMVDNLSKDQTGYNVFINSAALKAQNPEITRASIQYSLLDGPVDAAITMTQIAGNPGAAETFTQFRDMQAELEFNNIFDELTAGKDLESMSKPELDNIQAKAAAEARRRILGTPARATMELAKRWVENHPSASINGEILRDLDNPLVVQRTVESMAQSNHPWVREVVGRMNDPAMQPIFAEMMQALNTAPEQGMTQLETAYLGAYDVLTQGGIAQEHAVTYLSEFMNTLGQVKVQRDLGLVTDTLELFGMPARVQVRIPATLDRSEALTLSQRLTRRLKGTDEAQELNASDPNAMLRYIERKEAQRQRGTGQTDFRELMRISR